MILYMPLMFLFLPLSVGHQKHKKNKLRHIHAHMLDLNLMY